MTDPVNPVTGSKLKPWRRIEDLPANWPEMRHPELPVLAELWKERRGRMEHLQVVEDFHKRLVREWAIETGILERLYDIDRGTTMVLIERGIDATLIPHGATNRDVNEVVQMLKDHVEVSEGLFDFVANKQPLTNVFIRQIHQTLTRHQDKCDAMDSLGNFVRVDLLKGQWKKLPNNPSRDGLLAHEYAPPEHVQCEMEQLIAFHGSHPNVDPVVEAAFLHHRFTQIHPFQDGNGRVARCLANIVMLRAQMQPLVLTRDDRGDYITALEAADEGDLKPLVKLFANVEKRAFLKALSLSTDVIDRAAGLSAIIEATAAKVLQRSQAAFEQRRIQEQQTTDLLMSIAVKNLQSLADQFNSAFDQTDFRASDVKQSDEQSLHYFRSQIIHCARLLHYFANLSELRRWARVTIRDGFISDIVISFHKVGNNPSELMGCSAFVTEKGSPDNREYPAGPACEQPFLYTTTMPAVELTKQFQHWLDGTLVVALEIWRRKLGA